MRPSVRYALTALAISVALFAAWRGALTAGVRSYVVADLGFAIPVLALILASARDWRRKGTGLAALAVVFVLGDVVAHLLGANADDVRLLDDSMWTQLGAAAFHVFRFGVPIAALVLFADGDLKSLWTSGSAPRQRSFECPVCGRRRSGLEAHVRDAHGPRVLERLKAEGRL